VALSITPTHAHDYFNTNVFVAQRSPIAAAGPP
jgi:hypothetical protein